jgi:hypothetical protein
MLLCWLSHLLFKENWRNREKYSLGKANSTVKEMRGENQTIRTFLKMKRVFIIDHLAEEDNKSGSMKTIQAAQKSQKRMGRILA